MTTQWKEEIIDVLSLILVSEKELSTSTRAHAKLPTQGIKNTFHIPSRSAGTKERKNVEESCMDDMGNFSLKREGCNYYIIDQTQIRDGFLFNAIQ